MARTWVEISRTAFAHNVKALKATLDPGVAFCAVVKSNAYGHGLKEIVELAVAEGVALFGVDSVDEALTVRTLAPRATIFILGMTVHERLPDAVACRAIQPVYSVDGLRAIRAAAKQVGLPALITLEIETGLHRLGAEGRGLTELLEYLKICAGEIYVVSVASHLAGAEDLARSALTASQYEAFTLAAREIYRAGFEPEHYHVACSAAAILHELPYGTCVRFGLMMYGLWPSTDAKRAGTLGKRHAELKPVLAWKTRVAQVKEVKPGGGIGYGHTVVVNRVTRIAVLPVGYYDGFDRGLSNNGTALIHGTRCNILGKVCMNMAMIDVSNVPGVLGEGTEVTIIGRDGMHAITADDLADRLQTINYEVVTRINPAISRLVV